MRLIGAIITIVSTFALLFFIGSLIYGEYQYEKDITSLWSLADKASTIEQKSEYMDKFVTVLEESGLEGQHDALFLTTPDNSFDKNLEALKSLQLRLREIKAMDVTSFEYQTAIQQITAQEQGEALRMLTVFKGVWWKANYLFLWDWVGMLCILTVIAFLVMGLYLSV